MMKKTYSTLLTLLVPVLMIGGVLAMAPLTAQASPASEVQKGITAAGDADDKNCGPENDKHKCTIADSVNTISSVLLFIVGTVAVIMIILGGIRYTTSNGDASQITSAKNTILYSVIGVVVALLAFAIVRFVVNQFAK